jgi:amidase/aspartyl-tRNA(Asn)/glutamyl-tRNA(Gln) amidotransferase subunit A
VGVVGSQIRGACRDTLNEPVRELLFRTGRKDALPGDKPVDCSTAPAGDLSAARARIAAGRASAVGLIDACAEAAATAACERAFLKPTFDAARATALRIDRTLADGAPLTPLAGLAVSLKDLFDVEGDVTAAGSRVLADAPPATADAPAVARLRAAGAAFVGRTNMSEFAFSGVGLNPHHGTPANAALHGRGEARIPGGSTSGGATSVAAGAAWAALGSDTGGSIRIPAALQGLVGFKNTARLTPTQGAVPLSTTLDTVCAITRSVRDAVLLHQVLAARRVALPRRAIGSLRFAVPTTLMLDALEPEVAAAFERALAALRDAGAQVVEIGLRELGEVAAINAAGGFSAAESWAWHRTRLAAEEARYDPRVAARIRRGATMSAADYIDLLIARRDWIARMERAIAGFDALLSPTVPCVAPALAPLVADDATFFAANALLLRNPSVVNLLDGCAISMPCQRPGERPVGLMAWSSALRDDPLLDAALAIEPALAR